MTEINRSRPVLEVNGLCKEYPGFLLDNVSFSLAPGTITGFVGRNGAGKTTTLRCLLDLVHPTRGEIRFFGQPYNGDLLEIRQHVGFASGTTNYYMQKKLSVLSAVTSSFYTNWDGERHNQLMEQFSLDPDKTPAQLSAGMKVKYSIATALSYHASLLILDEPTSGLDPASRADLLEIFLQLVENEGVTILFSTQITSDLEDYADNIIYIREGQIIADESLESFTGKYRMVKFGEKPSDSDGLIGLRRIRGGWDALVCADAVPAHCAQRQATLNDIMIHVDNSRPQRRKPERSQS